MKRYKNMYKTCKNIKKLFSLRKLKQNSFWEAKCGPLPSYFPSALFRTSHQTCQPGQADYALKSIDTRRVGACLSVVRFIG